MVIFSFICQIVVKFYLGTNLKISDETYTLVFISSYKCKFLSFLQKKTQKLKKKNLKLVNAVLFIYFERMYLSSNFSLFIYFVLN